jgi:spore coat polysaccharide biosynthesis protein SpsF
MKNILFRCDGSVGVGMGHVVRCLALADELQENHRCNIHFAMRKSELGINKVKESYPVLEPNEKAFDYANWLKDCVKKTNAHILTLDVRDGLTRQDLKQIKKKTGIKVVDIDDPEDKRLEADLAFYPPIPQVKQIDWTGFTGKFFVGWEWVILRKEFSQAPCLPRGILAQWNMKSIPSERRPFHWGSKLQAPSSVHLAPCPKIPRILVTMGGSDPQSLTLKAVKALEILDEDFEAVVVLGTGFQHKKQLNNLLPACKHRFDVRENVQNMVELMAQSDLAVASFGVTAYELAAIGVPAIYLCLTEDHAESASAFVEEGIAISLGVFTYVTTEMIATRISSVINDKSLLSELANNARKHIDGQGVTRISRLIIERFETENE